MSVVPEISASAVLLSALAAFFIGMLWYSPVMFSKSWIKSAGLSEKDLKKGGNAAMIRSMVLGLLSYALMAFVLAHFVDYLQIDNAKEGAVLGFWVWLGFVGTTQLGSVLWEMKPLSYFLINTMYSLLVLVVMGAILGHWPI
ncbi:MAG: DUF1761 domain-containing protein [Patescibacteria group bacterium]